MSYEEEFSVGDKVMAGECEATVIGVMPADLWSMADNWTEYKIKYDRDDLGTAIILGKKLRKVGAPIEAKIACECGVSKLGYGKHSDWCAIVRFGKE